MSKTDSEHPDEVGTHDESPAINFYVSNNEAISTYEAISPGDSVSGGMTYNVGIEDRLVLVAVAVFPEFRGRDIATELIRRVLEDLRDGGKTVTVACPIVWAIIGRHSGYNDLVDPRLPGLRKAQQGN